MEGIIFHFISSSELWNVNGGQGPDLQPTCSGYPLNSFTILVGSVALIQRLLSVRVQKCASSLVGGCFFLGLFSLAAAGSFAVKCFLSREKEGG